LPAAVLSGFEAASRGATRVVMVDHSPKVVAALANNAKILGQARRLKIVRSDAVRFLASVNSRFDVLFLDPPFHDGWMDRLAPIVPGVLAADGIIYAEAERAPGGLGIGARCVTVGLARCSIT
jgi:16S rRNA (guanine966-N2)-methyltransferase